MSISSRATLPKSGKKGIRKSSSLPAETVEYLKAWMMSPEHIAHPYPTEPEKAKIMADTDIELKQLTNWFVNNRKRYWKPRVEARLQQQARTAAAAAQAHAAAVAVATASINTNLVSPDSGSKSTLAITPDNGFVTFDLGSHAMPENTRTSSSSYPHLVETDLARVMADQRANAHRDERIVSESSSSASVTASEEGTSSASVTASEEGSISDSASSNEEDTVQGSIKTTTTTSEEPPQQQQLPHPTTEDQQDSSSQQATDESSSFSSCSIASESEEDSVRPLKKRAYKRTAVTEITQPRKKFGRVSIGLWRESCKNAAHHTYDESLPSLEEATQLFGYN